MSPTRTDEGMEEMAEVRLRYWPVGDVLTVSVRSGLPEGPRFQTEPDDHTSIEWLRMPDGSTRMAAMQVIGASEGVLPTRESQGGQLPETLRTAALSLTRPGRADGHHLSAHVPTRVTDFRQTTVRTTASDMTNHQLTVVPLLDRTEMALDRHRWCCSIVRGQATSLGQAVSQG